MQPSGDNGTADLVVERRAARRFIILVCALLACAMATTAAVAITIDPLNTFGTGMIPPVVSDDRREKPEAYQAEAAKPQVVILGSSRVWKIAPACVKELTGLDTFNFGLSNAVIEDYWAVVGFIGTVSSAPLREVILGIDVEAFCAEAEVDLRGAAGLLQNTVNTRRFFAFSNTMRALFGWQDFALGVHSLRKHLRASAAPDEMRWLPDGEVVYTWEDRIAHDPSLRTAKTEEVVGLLRSNFAKRNFTRLSPERLRLFDSLLEKLHAQGTTVRVFIPPPQASIVSTLPPALVPRRRELKLHLAELARNGIIQYLPFDNLAEIRGDSDGYFDGLHMTQANSNRVVLALYGHDHGCGL